jgi:hypothetical protein
MKLALLTEVNDLESWRSPNLRPDATSATIVVSWSAPGESAVHTERFMAGNRAMALKRLRALSDQGYQARGEIRLRGGESMPLRGV